MLKELLEFTANKLIVAKSSPNKKRNVKYISGKNSILRLSDMQHPPVQTPKWHWMTSVCGWRSVGGGR